MAKNTDNERESFDRINGIIQERIGNMQEQVQEAAAKAAEMAEKNRKLMLTREVGRCFLAAACVAGLYMAEHAGLIAPVLTDPMSAIALICFGWHLCKIGKYRGRK